MPTDGWEQVRAGLALIESSGLARWDHARRILCAAEAQDFEAAASRVNREFGRVIMWIIFSVGVEYVLKGACLLRGLIRGNPKKVLRPPLPSEDVEVWSEKALVKQESAVRETVISFGTLNDLPLENLLKGLPKADVALAGFTLLRESIRNRDAHQYVRNVRAAHFRTVPDLLVPALNSLLLSFGPDELRG